MDLAGIGGGGRRINGVVIGIVVDNKHPEGEYRVKVKFPWVRDADRDGQDFITTWLRVASPFAGAGRGMYFLPEQGDEVLVAFEHGDLRRGFVIGSLWNGVDLPPVDGIGTPPDATTDPMGNDLEIATAASDNKLSDGKNDGRLIYSRAGHLVMLDDSDKPKVVIKSSTGHVVVLNDDKNCISIYDRSGGNYVHIDGEGPKITLETKDGDIDILCKNGTLNVEAKKIVTKASDTAEHEATTKMTHKSKEVVVKGDSLVDVDGGKIELN